MKIFALKFIVAVVIIEAIAEIISDSDIFKRLRAEDKEWKDKNWFQKLLSCGYCESVWLGPAVAFLLKMKIVAGSGLLDWGWATKFWFVEALLWGLVVHRFSNVWHEALRRFFSGAPLRFVLQKVNVDDKNGSNGGK